MAKRDPEPEALPDEQLEPEVPTVGERLRAAREEKGVSLEDIAAQTRIPQRHLASIETADWDTLPAPTYTSGFAKSYALAVGLERQEIGDQLREEMGGQRFASTSADVFEPADPRRTMPRGLVIGAIIAVVLLVVGMSWLNKRSLEQPEGQNNIVADQAIAPAAAPKAAPARPLAATQGPVVLTATAPAWIQVTDRGKSLFAGMLQSGQTYTVPATAAAPMLKAGKPEALNVTVGGVTAPAVGPPGKVTTVSLTPAALMKGPATSAAVAPHPGRKDMHTPPGGTSAAPSTEATPANAGQE